MVTEIDDKGKYFTEVIKKTPVSVIIQTASQRIEGYISIRPDERLKDEVDRKEPFVAVTEAKIYHPDGEFFASTHFVAVNRSQIIWILPLDEIIPQT